MQTTRTAWILAYDPNVFDLDQLRADGNDLQAWIVTQRTPEIRPGDPFILWRMGGVHGLHPRDVIAHGTITRGAESEPNLHADYWSHNYSDGFDNVRIQVTEWLTRPITFGELRGPLGGNRIMQRPQELPRDENYRLTRAEWRAVADLLPTTQTYEGVPIPPAIHQQWTGPIGEAWRLGVDAVLTARAAG